MSDIKKQLLNSISSSSEKEQLIERMAKMDDDNILWSILLLQKAIGEQNVEQQSNSLDLFFQHIASKIDEVQNVAEKVEIEGDSIREENKSALQAHMDLKHSFNVQSEILKEELENLSKLVADFSDGQDRMFAKFFNVVDEHIKERVKGRADSIFDAATEVISKRKVNDIVCDAEGQVNKVYMIIAGTSVVLGFLAGAGFSSL